VTATADPPPKLLIGRADRVEIAGSDVHFRTFHAASVDLVLSDVDIVARTASRISGRITAAELTTNAGEATGVDVAIDGPADAAGAVIVVDVDPEIAIRRLVEQRGMAEATPQIASNVRLPEYPQGDERQRAGQQRRSARLVAGGEAHDRDVPRVARRRRRGRRHR